MEAFKFVTLEGVCGRFDPVGEDRFKITTYTPVGNSETDGARLAADLWAHSIPTSNADYSGMAPVPGDVEAMEIPTMHFEPPKPKPQKSDASGVSGRAPRTPHHAPTNNEEPLALPVMKW